MVIQEGIFKNDQNSLFPCFTFRIPETGVYFYCESREKYKTRNPNLSNPNYVSKPGAAYFSASAAIAGC